MSGSPSHRSKGVGSFLIENSIKRGKETGARKIYATTSSLNIPAFYLFKSAGFIIEATLPNQYRNGTEEYIWGLFLDIPQDTINPRNSLMDNFGQERHTIRKYLDLTDRAYLEEAVNTIREWHADLDNTFIEGIVKATSRNLDYETKGKEIFVSEVNGKHSGIAVTTPKRGGPVKVYPLFGSPSSQSELIGIIRNFYIQKGYKKLYTFVPHSDHKHLNQLGNLGFTQRGILRSPYKDGYDLAILDIQI